jgi:outer membrane protein assembly complex protein YaeT
VNVANLSVNDKTGAVNLEIEVKPGKKSIVELIRVETREHTNTPPVSVETIQTNVPFSKIWQQDFAQQLRATNFHKGYPDTRVEVEPAKREPADEIVEMQVLAKVNRGERIVLHDVKFEGLKHTRKSVVERRVELKEGDSLDRIEAEQGRYRLARLGIFDTVNLRYDRVDEHTRDVIYSVQEGKRLNIYLLAGYGSYELVRGGIEMEQHNIWGLAHHARLRAVQSLKATSADYRYTMPEFFGESVDAFLRGFYLQREEVDFTREEYGGGAGARTFVDQIQSDLSARYDYQVLSAFETDVTEGPTNALVGSVTFELTHDRRDSPLYPRRGYKVSGTFETASEFLGGEVNFWRFETQNSFHQPLDAGRWLHFGLSHGFAVPLGEARRDLPFNKRFFPGGDNSVRGYQYGEAGPRNASGKIVGAETYTIGNIEFEQALTDKISLVSFIDALGFGRRLEDYPFDDYRISIGGGLRWKTIIGPVRLEYGYNVIQRRFDPIGTIHFSIGAPF